MLPDWQMVIISTVQAILYLSIYKSISGKMISLLRFLIFWFFIAIVIIKISYFVFVPLILTLVLFNKNQNLNLIYFYSVYTIFFGSLFGYFFSIICWDILGEAIFQQYDFLLNITIIPFFPLLCHYLLMRLLKPNLDFLRKFVDQLNKKILFLINALLTICCTIQFTIYYIEAYIINTPNPFRFYTIALFIFTIVLLFVYLNRKIRELDKQLIQSLKDAQLSDLTSYVQQIELMYDEIQSFRHDYRNVLISLNESIKTKDLTIIEQTYTEVLNREGIALSDDHYSLAKLNNLKTLPIKGVMSTHIISAWQKNIQVHLEIEDIIEQEAIDVLDYVRIVSILLDNAIEATEQTNEPKITIAFIKESKNQEIRLLIENTCLAEKIDIAKIFQKGYSTKGADCGLGLFTVMSLLNNYSNVSLQTECHPFLFRQLLIIKKE